jgi:Redoxin
LSVPPHGSPPQPPNRNHRSNRAVLDKPVKPQVLTNFAPPQLFLSDPGTKFSQSIGWTMGERTARYAIVVDHGKVVYAEKEPGRDVTVSTTRPSDES